MYHSSSSSNSPSLNSLRPPLRCVCPFLQQSGHPQCVPLATWEPFGHIRCNCNPIFPLLLAILLFSPFFVSSCSMCALWKATKTEKGSIAIASWPLGLWPLSATHHPLFLTPRRFVCDDVRKRFNLRLSLVFLAFSDAQ